MEVSQQFSGNLKIRWELWAEGVCLSSSTVVTTFSGLRAVRSMDTSCHPAWPSYMQSSWQCRFLLLWILLLKWFHTLLVSPHLWLGFCRLIFTQPVFLNSLGPSHEPFLMTSLDDLIHSHGFKCLLCVKVVQMCISGHDLCKVKLNKC